MAAIRKVIATPIKDRLQAQTAEPGNAAAKNSDRSLRFAGQICDVLWRFKVGQLVSAYSLGGAGTSSSSTSILLW